VKQSIVKELVAVSLRIRGDGMDYGSMDIFDEVREIKILLDKFPNLNKEETEQLRVLSNNISVDISSYQYDTKVMKILEEQWEFKNQ